MALDRREDLNRARRVVVKLGTTTITRSDAFDGRPIDRAFSEFGVAVGRVASIVEQVCDLRQSGHDVIVVTSGAIGVGKQVLRSQGMLERSLRRTLEATTAPTASPRACAAAGQSGLMALYEAMFDQYGVRCSQILLTNQDLQDDSARNALRLTLDELLRMQSVPICNENDVVSRRLPTDIDWESGVQLTDNDALAALLAVQSRADLLIILSDVSGVYNLPPGHANSRLLDVFRPGIDQITLGATSRLGRGGMGAKIKSAEWALRNGCAVVIANGSNPTALREIMDGKRVGTLFSLNPKLPSSPDQDARTARAAGRVLGALEPETRAAIILRMAELLEERSADILAANALDVSAARNASINAAAASSSPDIAPDHDLFISRLGITQNVINSLIKGLHSVAEQAHTCIGKVLRKTQVAENLVLQQETSPVGVLLAIIEARPEALIQLAALSIATGNALLISPGSGAARTNKALHDVVAGALSDIAPETRDACILCDEKTHMQSFLELDEQIDLVIPRGSTKLVKEVKSMTKIPVIGHEASVCHVFIDADADFDMALNLTIDSKCNAPSACNSVNTILVHSSIVPTFLPILISKLQQKGVTVFVGPKAYTTFPLPQCRNFSEEFNELGGMGVTIEVVEDVHDAARHINIHGGGHTDMIVTKNEKTALIFRRDVDSACVFHNASTRFADGYRFGLGAEASVSTSKSHARGPVGIEGLMTIKWCLRGNGDLVQDFIDGTRPFIHKPLPVEESKPANDEGKSDSE